MGANELVAIMKRLTRLSEFCLSYKEGCLAVLPIFLWVYFMNKN